MSLKLPISNILCAILMKKIYLTDINFENHANKHCISKTGISSHVKMEKKQNKSNA